MDVVLLVASFLVVFGTGVQAVSASEGWGIPRSLADLKALGGNVHDDWHAVSWGALCVGSVLLLIVAAKPFVE